MVPLSYYQPRNLSETFDLLDSLPGSYRYFLGGTDVIVDLKKIHANLGQRGQMEQPLSLIDLKQVRDISASINANSAGGLTIGARVTLRQIEQSHLVWATIPMLAQAAGCVGSFQTRNRATVAGNLCTASPSADLAPPILAAGGSVRLVGRSGSRLVDLRDFFIGPRQTAIHAEEVLTEVVMPLPAPYSSYARFTPRGALDLAFVGCAIVLSMEGKRCAHCRIALGAVAPTPFRAYEAERILRGELITTDLISAAATSAAAAAKPISDIRASAEFRRSIITVLVQRTAVEALERGKTWRGGDWK